MNDELMERALRLESLLPRVQRAMYRPHGDDPLSELPVAQLRVVRLLFAENKTHSAVSEELGISLSAVTQMANRLENVGLLERVEDQQDRRVKFLCLSKKGKELMQQRQQRRVGRIKDVLSRLTSDEQSAILASMEKLMLACKLSGASDRDAQAMFPDVEQPYPMPPLGQSA